LAAYLFEDGLRAGFPEKARDVFAEGSGLVAWGRGALADVLRAVDGAHASFEDEFPALGACPRAERNLAAAL
jgi:hypothetical protein